MADLEKLLSEAGASAFKRRIVNFVLARFIPFNQPHGFRISEVFDDGVKINLPYKRVNKNHINGIHACALATLSEYASGLTLARHLNRENVRLIMKDLKMTYHYQAKSNVSVEMHISRSRIEKEILLKLQSDASAYFNIVAEVYDSEKNHICTGETNWQVKKWDKVRTKS